MQEPDDEHRGPLQVDLQDQAQPAEVMGDLLDTQQGDVYRLHRGQVVEGLVVRVGKEEVLVDIGAKSEAVVPAHEIPARELQELRVGDKVLAAVLQPEDREGHPVLSLTLAQMERHWRELQQHLEQQDVLLGEVTGFNKGGLIVSVLGVRGFVPLSQLSHPKRGGSSEEPLEERLGTMRGERIGVKVIEVNRRRNRLILSQRAAAQERRVQERQRLLKELRPGEVRRGVVSNVCDFGVFVDLGGADGLIHLSELSWERVGHPRQVLSVGQEIDVHVLAVDHEQERIALSLRRLQGEPWERLTEKYRVGDMVTGRITKLAPFGAFAQIEDGVEGLIHISELSDQRITHSRQVVREGDSLQLKILRIDVARHRLGLSLRGAMTEPSYEEASVEGSSGAAEESSRPSEDQLVSAEATELLAGVHQPAEEVSMAPGLPVGNVETSWRVSERGVMLHAEEQAPVSRSKVDA